MKTRIVILFTIFFALQLHAQIVLNTDDLPSAGNIQVSVKVDSLQAETILPGDAGANMLWDFSNLMPCCNGIEFSYDTLSWILPANTPYAVDFPLSNLAYENDCYLVHSHETHLDEEFCNYTYLIKDDSGVMINGVYKFGAKPYDNMRFVFPILHYGDTLHDDARLVYYSSNDTTKVLYSQNISIADGWGTVITPVDTADAMRIFTTETIYDSMYVNSQGYLQSKTDDNFYYHWITKKLGFPVLQISKGSLHQENTFYQEVKYAFGKTEYLSTPELIKSNPIKIINEWGSRTVTFIIPEDIFNQKYFIEFFDITGRKINPSITFFNNKIVSSLENYPLGIYLYRIGNATQTLKTGKISVQ